MEKVQFLKKQIGIELKKERISKNLNPKEAAAIIPVSYQTYIRAERKGFTNVNNLFYYCEKLEIDSFDLLTRSILNAELKFKNRNE